MVEKRLYRIIAALGAIIIYFFFAYTLVDFVKNSKTIIQDFGYNVDDAIVVELSEPAKEQPVEKPKAKPTPKPKPVPPVVLPPEPSPEPKPIPVVKPIILPPEPQEKPEEKVEPAKETPPEPVQEKKESRDLVAKSARDLFSTVRTDNYDKVMDERRKQDAARASRLKKQKAEQARKKTEAKKQQKARAAAVAAAKAAMQEIEQSTASSHKKSGAEDTFWSPVSSHIQALWNRTIQTQDGLNADVKITIDNRGRLSYRIKRLSNNSLFDQKLHIFLQNLEYESFPKYRGGSSTSRVILFEDQEGL